MPRYSPLWRSQENLPVEVKLEQTLADGKSQPEEEEGSSAWVGRRIMGLGRSQSKAQRWEEHGMSQEPQKAWGPNGDLRGGWWERVEVAL